MPEYPTNPKYTTLHYYDLAAFIKEDDGSFTVEDIKAGLSLTTHQMEVSKRRVAWRLADHFAADNPAFDRERFLEACGLD